MTKLKIAFDLDDTLIIPAVATGFDIDVPHYENIAIYRWFQAQGHYMIVWSGGGDDYAKRWGEKLGLDADEYRTKVEENSKDVDLAFDDADCELAKVNVKVKRINNRIVRYPDKVGRGRNYTVTPDET